MTGINVAGVYQIAPEAYHSDPCETPSLSTSVGKVLLSKSPRHAFMAHPRLNPNYVAEEKAAFDLGSAAHALMLGDPTRFAIIDAADWRTAEAKKKRELARLDGKIPLLTKHWEDVQKMVAAGKLQLASHEDASDAFIGGKGVPEVCLIWQEGKIWCRCKLDWMPKQGSVFYDYKSTGMSANPDSWERQFYAMGYDFQCAFYRRGIQKVLGIGQPHFEFVVQETDDPYALAVVAAHNSTVEMADRKVDKVLEWWGWCLENNKWPGYPNRTVTLGMPTYVENQWLAIEERDALAKEGNKNALFERAINWQAPIKPGEKK